MTLTFEPVHVAAGRDNDGQLVFTDDRRLVALLTRLSDEHGDMAGTWFFEVGFGALDGPDHPSFPDLAQAEKWILGHMRQRTRQTGAL